MALEVLDRYLNGLILFTQKEFNDERGFFTESYRKEDLEKAGIYTNFVQDNHSRSRKNVFRGLHFQWNPPMGKLIRVSRGAAIFFELDIRPGSPTFGKYQSFEISDKNMHCLWAPAGFANGFFALEDDTDVLYKCTEYWNPRSEGCLLWNDKDIELKLPLPAPVLSEKDKSGISLVDWISHPAASELGYHKMLDLYAR